MTRIRSTLFMAFVGLSVLAIATADAQQRRGPQAGGPQAGGRGQAGRPGGGGFRIGNGQLLAVEKVRTELGVSDATWEKIQAQDEQARGSDQDREAMRDRFAQLREMSEEDRQAEFAKMGEERAKRDQEREQQLASLLTEAQVARLNQIRIQLGGFNVIGTPEVAGKLELSPGQGERLKAIKDKLDEQSQEMRDAARNGGGAAGEDRMAQMQEIMAKMRQLQSDALKEAVDTVMTPAQQATWKEMVGEPFEIEMRDLFQGRGPGGPGQGGPGQGGRGQGGRGQGARGQGGRGPAGGAPLQ